MLAECRLPISAGILNRVTGSALRNEQTMTTPLPH